MHPSETVFCLLRDDPIRTIFWHPDSALREVCVVGRASVDMTGYIAAALRCFLDPRYLRCLDFRHTFHVEFVATRYPGHENQHGQNQVNSGGEFDVLGHDQNVAIPGNCEPTSRSTVRQSASDSAAGSGTTQPIAPPVGLVVPSKAVPILAPVTAANTVALAAVALCAPFLRMSAVPADNLAVSTNGTPATTTPAAVATSAASPTFANDTEPSVAIETCTPFVVSANSI